MPLEILLKEPKISIFAKDEEPETEDKIGIKMAIYGQYDDGEPMKIPINNIALILTTTDEEIKNRKKEAEERRKKAEQGGMRLPTARIIGPNPGGFIPPGGGRRKH